ncbi:MAG: hypothetical protein J6L62_04685 [Clostridia bacterium]|nr:hypothetical protein [Clostridia bacterium]
MIINYLKTDPKIPGKLFLQLLIMAVYNEVNEEKHSVRNATGRASMEKGY